MSSSGCGGNGKGGGDYGYTFFDVFTRCRMELHVRDYVNEGWLPNILVARQLFGYAVCLLKSILKELQLCGYFIDNVGAAPWTTLVLKPPTINEDKKSCFQKQKWKVSTVDMNGSIWWQSNTNTMKTLYGKRADNFPRC
ncbi:unnamed protein product [Prunus armeniaca]